MALNIRDGFSSLIEDHRTVEQLYEQFKSTDELQNKQEYIKVLIRELSIHSNIEEQYVYPLMDKLLDHGSSLRKFSLDQHQQLKDILKYLDTTELTQDTLAIFNQKTSELMETLKHHTDHEESDVFTNLRAKMEMKDRVELLSTIENARVKVPTHPHPHAPNIGVVNSIQGLIDRSLDKFKGRDER
jgi:hemerythrin superfamily protein